MSVEAGILDGICIGKAKTDIVVPVIRSVVVAVRTPRVVRVVVPGPATQHTGRAFAVHPFSSGELLLFQDTQYPVLNPVSTTLFSWFFDKCRDLPEKDFSNPLIIALPGLQSYI